ncbi:GPI inositol deacylase [Actinomortierella wolfii]|nr:GPI inositol deacylase [Actinomortierella wolfii]
MHAPPHNIVDIPEEEGAEDDEVESVTAKRIPFHQANHGLGSSYLHQEHAHLLQDDPTTNLSRSPASTTARHLYSFMTRSSQQQQQHHVLRSSDAAMDAIENGQHLQQQQASQLPTQGHGHVSEKRHEVSHPPSSPTKSRVNGHLPSHYNNHRSSYTSPSSSSHQRRTSFHSSPAGSMASSQSNLHTLACDRKDVTGGGDNNVIIASTDMDPASREGGVSGFFAGAGENGRTSSTTYLNGQPSKRNSVIRSRTRSKSQPDPLPAPSQPTFRSATFGCSMPMVIAFLMSMITLGAIFHSNFYRQVDTKGCEMSYMTRKYIKVPGFDRDKTPFAGKYGLYVYRSEYDYNIMPDDDKFHPLGIPVLFIPGNAGSKAQVRSIAKEAARYYYENVLPNRRLGKTWLRPLDFFTAHILTLYDHTAHDPNLPKPTSVLILGHSMGGVVARSLFTMKNFNKDSVNTIVTAATPHIVPPVALDFQISNVYSSIDSFWTKGFQGPDAPLQNVSLISIAGGNLDIIVNGDSGNIHHIVPQSHGFSVFSSSIPHAWVGADHVAILWCNQIVKAIGKALVDVADARQPGQVLPLPDRMRVFRNVFLTGVDEHVEDPSHRKDHMLGVNSRLDVYLCYDADSETNSAAASGQGKLACQRSVLSAMPVPASLEGLYHPFMGREFRHIYQKLNAISDQFKYVVVLDRGSHFGDHGFLVAEFQDEAKTTVNVETTTLGLMLNGIRIESFPSNKASLVSTLRLPNIDNSLITYILKVSRPGCKGHHAFLPMLRQSSWNMYEDKYIVNVADRPQGVEINFHGDIPYFDRVLLPGRKGMELRFWADSSCSAPLQIDLQVDKYGSLGKVVIRYRMVVLSFSFLVVVLTLRAQFRGWNENKPFEPFGVVLSRLIKSTFLKFSAFLALISLIQSFQTRPVRSLEHGSYPGTSGEPVMGYRELDFEMLRAATTSGEHPYYHAPTSWSLVRLNDILLGANDTFFWFLAPVFFQVSVGIVILIWTILNGLVVMSADVLSFISRRGHARFPPRTKAVRRRIITTMVLFIMVATFVPYQFAFIVAVLVHIASCVRALLVAHHASSNHAQAAWDRYHYLMSIFVLFFLLLPCTVPVLMVWVRNLSVQWYEPFSSDHRLDSIAPFIFYVEAVTSGAMMPRTSESLIAMEDETRRKNEMNPPENAPEQQEQNAMDPVVDDSTTQTTTASKGSKRNAYEPKKKGPEKPLSLFFLPNDFIPSLVPQAQAYFDFQALIDGVVSTATTTTTTTGAAPHVSTPTSLDTVVPSCRTCGVAQFESYEKQREHMKLDWHRYNLKQQLLDKSAQPISEQAFEEMLQDLSSLSGSGSDDTEEETDGEDAYGPRDDEYLSDSIMTPSARRRGQMKKKKQQRRRQGGKSGDNSHQGSRNVSDNENNNNNDNDDDDDDGDLSPLSSEDDFELDDDKDAKHKDDKAEFPRGAWEDDDPDTQIHQLMKKLELTAEKNRQAKSQDPVLILQQQMLERQIQEAKMTPLIWFTSSLYDETVRFGVYKNALRNRGKTDDILATLQSIQITPAKFVPKQKKNKDQDKAKKGKQENDGEGEHGEKKNDDKEGEEDKSAIVAQPDPQPTARYWTMILIGGGHFAGMIVDLAGTTTLHGREMKIIHHKTFHRYTVRRKQGGSQATHGIANSAGARIRMYNEKALRDEVREQLNAWGKWIERSECVFIHAPGHNRRTLLYEGSVLTNAYRSGRLRSLPFMTRRPTLKELKRAYTELSTIKVSILSEEMLKELEAKEQEELERALEERASASTPDPEKQKIVEHVEKPPVQEVPPELLKLVDLVKRGRAEAVSNHLLKHGIDPSQLLPVAANGEYDIRRTPTILHLASVHGHASVVKILLETHHADPTITSLGQLKNDLQDQHEGSINLEEDALMGATSLTAYDVAKDKETRNAFRRAMAQLPDDWDWVAGAHVPSALTPEMEAEQERKAKEKAKKILDAERERKKAREATRSATPPAGPDALHNNKLAGAAANKPARSGQTLGGPSVLGKAMASAASANAQISPELRMKMERERRARAAEARIAAMKQAETVRKAVAEGKNVCVSCGKTLDGLQAFEKFGMKYCTTTCVAKGPA